MTQASRSLGASFEASVGAALDEALSAHPMHRAPGLVAAVFDAGGVFAWRAFGDASRGTVPVTRNTAFRIASMSKSFLAAAAMRLHERGELNLDVPVRTYVPEVRLLLGGVEYDATLRDFLANRSGLPEDNAWGDRQLGATRSAILALASEGLLLTAEPGARYQYSNLGMSFVGRAIECVTGHSVETEITEAFLEPLGLTCTRFTPEELPAGTEAALGYRTFDDGSTFAFEPYVGSGALACIGGLFSTVDDISAWANFLREAFDDAAPEIAVLSKRSRREMQRMRTPAPAPLPNQSRDLEALAYGLGLVVESDRRFGTVVQHSGGLPGFSSHMRWHVPSGIGVVVFGNSDSAETSQLSMRIHAGVLAVLSTHALPADSGASPVQNQGHGRWLRDAPWQETLAAAERLDRVFRGGEAMESISEWCAENVFEDVPLPVREAQLRAAIAAVGPLLIEQPPVAARLTAVPAPSEMSWQVLGERGAFECTLGMVGLHHPSLQSFSLSFHANETLSEEL